MALRPSQMIRVHKSFPYECNAYLPIKHPYIIIAMQKQLFVLDVSRSTRHLICSLPVVVDRLHICGNYILAVGGEDCFAIDKTQHIIHYVILPFTCKQTLVHDNKLLYVSGHDLVSLNPVDGTQSTLFAFGCKPQFIGMSGPFLVVGYLSMVAMYDFKTKDIRNHIHMEVDKYVSVDDTKLTAIKDNKCMSYLFESGEWITEFKDDVYDVQGLKPGVWLTHSLTKMRIISNSKKPCVLYQQPIRHSELFEVRVRGSSSSSSFHIYKRGEHQMVVLEINL